MPLYTITSVSGSSSCLFDIYYNTSSQSSVASIYGPTIIPATNLTFSQISSGTLIISVPDNANSILLFNTCNDGCPVVLTNFPSQTPTQTPTKTPTPTPTKTPTQTPTKTPTKTPTPTPTKTPCLCNRPFVRLPDNSGCIYTATTLPTIISNPLNPSNASLNDDYGVYGVRIYRVGGYTISGTVIGNYAYNPYPTVPRLWRFKMSNTSLWVEGNEYWPGEGNYPGTVTICDTINVIQPKTYYIGIGGDNDVTISINGVKIVAQPNDLRQDNFTFWSIYPVALSSGPNLIVLSGTNRSVVGAFAAEIYDNTLAQLRGATSESDLNIIFSTEDYRINGPKHGQGFCSNYRCPNGYNYDESTGLCLQIIKLPCNG